MMHIGAVLLALCSIGIGSSYGEDCGVIADFAFVIDSSASIWEPDFNKGKEFIEAVISSFPVGPKDTHVAAITFSDVVKTEFTFKQSQSWDNAKVGGKILNINFAAGPFTRTDRALARMTEQVFGPGNGVREGVPHICVLVTDGNSTYHGDTIKQAQLAKDAGIKIIAVAIGDKVGKDEIIAIASEPTNENAIFKSTYSELISETFQHSVALKACEVVKTTTPKATTEATTTPTEATTTTTEPTTTTTPEATTTPVPKDEPEKECQGKEVDILFVLDMSTSIWSVDFNRQLAFVSDVVDNFDIESGKSKVGLISFSDTTTMGFNFDQYTSKDAIKTAVMAVKKEDGITNTHLALNTTLEMFTPKHGSRPGVAHICILITDGISSQPKLTFPAAKRVHDKGIYVFAIGVGNLTDIDELQMMATKPADKYTFEVKNGYEALPRIKKMLAYQTCKVPGDQSRCLSDASAKIMFGLYGVGGQDRPDVVDIIRRIGGGFDLHKGKVTIGLMEVCGNAEIDSQTYESNSEFVGELNSAMTSSIGDMIVNIRNVFPKPKPNMKSRHVTILLVSGKPSDMRGAYREARRLHDKSTVYVINVGGANPGMAKFATNAKTHVFSTRDPSGFEYIAKRILTHLCKGQ